MTIIVITGASRGLRAAAARACAQRGMGVVPTYQASPFFLTHYQAMEFGDRGIRANAIAPGPIRIELGGGLTDEFEAALAAQSALARVREPKGGRHHDRQPAFRGQPVDQRAHHRSRRRLRHLTGECHA